MKLVDRILRILIGCIVVYLFGFFLQSFTAMAGDHRSGIDFKRCYGLLSGL